MLTLSCKPEESVVLLLPDGTRVEVSLVGLYRGRVALGFDAPPDVRIVRKELLGREKANTQSQ